MLVPPSKSTGARQNLVSATLEEYWCHAKRVLVRSSNHMISRGDLCPDPPGASLFGGGPLPLDRGWRVVEDWTPIAQDKVVGG